MVSFILIIFIIILFLIIILLLLLGFLQVFNERHKQFLNSDALLAVPVKYHLGVDYDVFVIQHSQQWRQHFRRPTSHFLASTSGAAGAATAEIGEGHERQSLRFRVLHVIFQ